MACLFGALAGCGAREQPAKPVDATLRVAVAVVGQQATLPYVEAARTAALRKEISLGFTSPGRVARVLVQESDRVRRGQLLAVPAN